jgi:hypothetical protein
LDWAAATAGEWSFCWSLLRERTFSRFLTEEAARILAHFGVKVRIFHWSRAPCGAGAPISQIAATKAR